MLDFSVKHGLCQHSMNTEEINFIDSHQPMSVYTPQAVCNQSECKCAFPWNIPCEIFAPQPHFCGCDPLCFCAPSPPPMQGQHRDSLMPEYHQNQSVCIL
uniref:Uncharacterized protein n=1 Tax=Poecilia reticulata TaxID=8081 RepID=A0A3P9NDT7_POERE